MTDNKSGLRGPGQNPAGRTWHLFGPILLDTQRQMASRVDKDMTFLLCPASDFCPRPEKQENKKKKDEPTDRRRPAEEPLTIFT